MSDFLSKIFKKLKHDFDHYRKEFYFWRSLENWEKVEFLRYFFIRLISKLPIKFSVRQSTPSSIFYLDEITVFGPNLKKMRNYHSRFVELIDDFRLKGLRAWEYGKLISLLDIPHGYDVLDIGPGASPLPYYLKQFASEVVTLDIPEPTEKHLILENANQQIKELTGTILNIPLASDIFDLIIAISTLEHLDANYPSRKPVDYLIFIERTKRALNEMVRVCKPNGYIFITSEAYLPQQKTDHWNSSVKYEGIGGAYKFSDIEDVFLKTLKQQGCELEGKVELSKKLLINDQRRSNYRGRYFTTFCLWSKKRSFLSDNYKIIGKSNIYWKKSR